MTRPLLSLAIPTYNRADFLRILLESLVVAIPAGATGIEVLVSDNASSDNSEAVVAEFQSRLPQLSYWRNAENLGAERNLLGLAERSSGKYLWLVGDDDVVCPDGITLLLAALSNSPDYLFLNHMTIRDDVVSRNPMFPSDLDGNIRDHNQLLSQFDLSNGLLTAIVFRQDAFLAVPRDQYLQHEKVGLSFFFATLLVARLHPRGRYIGQAVFLYRANNSDHAPNARRWTEVYGAGLRGVTARLEELGYAATTLRAFHASMVLKFYAVAMLSYRAKGVSTITHARSLIAHYGDVPLAWALLPATLTPKFVATRIQRWWRARKFGKESSI
jgi:abequosyltransferase